MTKWKPKPPPVTDLTRAQHDGWACCWCSKSLMNGARSAGIARGQMGAHVLDIEVYECGPRCPKRPRRPQKTTDRQGGDQT